MARWLAPPKLSLTRTRTLTLTLPLTLTLTLTLKSAEIEMAFHLLDPGPAPAVFDCSRFDGFCPKDAYSLGYRNALNPADRVPSAAPPRGLGGGGAAVRAWLLTAAAAGALALARRRPVRRLGGPEGGPLAASLRRGGACGSPVAVR